MLSCLVLRGRALLRELPNHLEHPEACLAIRILPRAQEALVGQRDQALDRLEIPDLLGAVDSHAADKRRQRAQQRLLAGLEQPIAPVDGGAQRALTLGQVARTGRQRQPFRQARLQRARGEHGDPRRGELQRQRQPIQAVADPLDCRPVPIVDAEPGAHRSRSREEQLAGVMHGQRGDVQTLLAADP